MSDALDLSDYSVREGAVVEVATTSQLATGQRPSLPLASGQAAGVANDRAGAAQPGLAVPSALGELLARPGGGALGALQRGWGAAKEGLSQLASGAVSGGGGVGGGPGAGSGGCAAGSAGGGACGSGSGAATGAGSGTGGGAFARVSWSAAGERPSSWMVTVSGAPTKAAWHGSAAAHPAARTSSGQGPVVVLTSAPLSSPPPQQPRWPSAAQLQGARRA